MSSLGEIIGAELYLMETVKRPAQYPIVALLTVSSSLGSMMALLIASFAASSSGEHWRLAFGFAFGIAFAGSAARMWLRETPEFSDMRLRLKNAIKEGDKQEQERIKRSRNQEISHTVKEDHKTVLMYFLSQLCWPVCFYFAYIYAGDILRISCGYTPAQVINQNLTLSMIQLVAYLVLTKMSHKIYPLKILKFQIVLFFGFILVLPYFLDQIHMSDDVLIQVYNAKKVLMIQCCFVLFGLDLFPAAPIFFSHFPVLKRFTYASVPAAISRAVMYPVASFGVVKMVEWFGSYGLWLIFLPVLLSFNCALRHFSRLEKISGNYPMRLKLKADQK
jgi:hypothetical protein